MVYLKIRKRTLQFTLSRESYRYAKSCHSMDRETTWCERSRSWMLNHQKSPLFNFWKKFAHFILVLKEIESEKSITKEIGSSNLNANEMLMSNTLIQKSNNFVQQYRIGGWHSKSYYINVWVGIYCFCFWKFGSNGLLLAQLYICTLYYINVWVCTIYTILIQNPKLHL